MKCPQAKLYEYRLPLHRPVTSGGPAPERDGLILALDDGHGHQGLGDIAPLPGHSRETLAQAKKEIIALLKRWAEDDLPAGIHKCDGAFAEFYGEGVPCASVRCGFESAVLSFLAATRHESLARLLHGKDHLTRLRLNALLAGPPNDIPAQAAKLLDEGYRALKIKVGNESWEEDVVVLKALSQQMGDRALLRLDANQRWDAATATRFGQELGPAVIDYIEEPFAEQGAIPDFYHETFIPVALDESLRGMTWPQISAIEGVDVLVVKPTIYGGIEESLRLIRAARDKGVKCVISSTFESGVGLHILAQLAAGFSRGVAVGLDTWRWFAAELTQQPISEYVRQGHWDLSDRLPALNLNAAHLRPIS